MESGNITREIAEDYTNMHMVYAELFYSFELRNKRFIYEIFLECPGTRNLGNVDSKEDRDIEERLALDGKKEIHKSDME